MYKLSLTFQLLDIISHEYLTLPTISNKKLSTLESPWWPVQTMNWFDPRNSWHLKYYLYFLTSINKSVSHKNFYYLGAKCWNNIPYGLRNLTDVKSFSNTYKSQMLSSITTDSNFMSNNSFDYFYTPIVQDS